ncbi:AAA family ATPase [Shewanella litorisediminis]|uniref:AAA family ATPase n=1 Tax=Shewanella litorisediminis TaxID=1173586 RepID=A0ABX7G2L4_9GAMM|nr:AAA family ATPase [Shewanella litorisediminis]MCL2917100.1 AAA family ATPase [Shewanella litorisediminis]QRH01577.1 AAA family ATPase [Shewanella litorisediminis]
MTFIPPSVLLPSQEALLLRMQHVACYSQQLVVIQGNEGAGKSTLLTALVSELEDYNSALVVCPMHADAAEIRRKILIQLLSDPLFDDEEPLGNTLRRLSKRLTKPLHILIDDAHHLPLELWAECLLLTNQQCAGRPIAITLAATPEVARHIYSQLTGVQRELMLPIDIDPLEIGEREALYYTLISRTDAVPYVPRDIVKSQLEQQKGRPGEVVALLERALQPEEQKRPDRRRLWRMLGAVTLTATFSLGLWYLVQSHPGEVSEAEPQEFPETGLLSPWGERQLTGYFTARAALLAEIELAEVTARAEQEAQRLADEAALEEARRLAEVPTAETIQSDTTRGKQEPHVEMTHDSAVQDVSLTQTQQSEGSKPLAAQVAADKAKPIESAAIQVPAVPENSVFAAQAWYQRSIQALPETGYTLQLATVSKRDSAATIFRRMASEPELRLVHYKDKLVILQGNYTSEVEANAQAKLVMERYGGGKPWVRAWKDLTSYRPLDSVSAGEISN